MRTNSFPKRAQTHTSFNNNKKSINSNGTQTQLSVVALGLKYSMQIHFFLSISGSA